MREGAKDDERLLVAEVFANRLEPDLMTLYALHFLYIGWQWNPGLGETLA
jgi:hypothetical protein